MAGAERQIVAPLALGSWLSPTRTKWTAQPPKKLRGSNPTTQTPTANICSIRQGAN